MNTIKGLSSPLSLESANDDDEFSRSRMLEDLHLAAELGKTLLERNRELEGLLKEKQTLNDDQKLEIEYLTKQTVALKEVNDSRLRIYEQLEVSIQDLERTNHRLQFENSNDKKHIKSLNLTIEQLEAKYEELQSVNDDLRLQIDVLKKKINRISDTGLPRTSHQQQQKEVVTLKLVESNNAEEFDEKIISSTTNCINAQHCCEQQTKCANSSMEKSSTTEQQRSVSTDEPDSGGMEEMAQILAHLRESRTQCSKDERMIAELEDQLAALEQQNRALENQVIQLSHRGDDLNMKSMHEELNTLDEVRQGQVCSKCLRSIIIMDQSSELGNLASAEAEAEIDDQSMLEALNATQHRASFSMNVQDHADKQSSPLTSSASRRENANPYKILVEKYEALVEVHRGNPIKSTINNNNKQQQDHEAEISGEFTTTKDTDEESDGHGDGGDNHHHHHHHKRNKSTNRKTFSTPTDFSEAETSSSGFLDEETSNKSTQTEGRVGSFLCTIADGEDCKFSIYDDANPFDSRFRDQPEYRNLFKEIFRVLKKAECEEEVVPAVFEANNAKKIQSAPIDASTLLLNEQQQQHELLPEFIDDFDTQSVMSSTMSELSTQNEGNTTIVENIIQSQNQPIPEAASVPSSSSSAKNECILRPLVRQPLEYLSVEVRKRSTSRRKNKNSDRSDSPMTHIIGSPKITYSNRPNSGRKGRGRGDNKQNGPNDEIINAWSAGNTLQFWATNNRNLASPTPSQGSSGSKGHLEFKLSCASQNLHKLKKLDMSYAEVLRNADNTKKRELQQLSHHYQQRRK